MNLKPCPFCGNTPVESDITPVEEMDDRRYFERRISCDWCECILHESMGWGEWKTMPDKKCSDLIGQRLVTAWNTRTDNERIEKLEAQLERVRPYIKHERGC